MAQAHQQTFNLSTTNTLLFTVVFNWSTEQHDERVLHMERLLHHNGVIAFEQMPVVGNVTEAIHGFVGVTGGMEHR